MAHFAKIDENNIVTTVIVAEQDFIDTQEGTWVQTSYNTRGGVHYEPNSNTPSADQSKALRKNYAGIGWTYDSTKDAFIPPKPYESWTLNETSCLWESPITYPSITTYGDSEKPYIISWDEDNLRWVSDDQEDPQQSYRWNVDTLQWVLL